VQAQAEAPAKAECAMLEANKIVAFVAVTDYEQARAFYEKTLGLKFISQDNFALVMDSHGTRLRMAKVANHQPAQFTVLGWETSDIEKQVSQLQAGGVKFERYPWLPKDGLPIWVAPSGDKVAWFKDPDGNILSLGFHVAP
jgi:catechol 2,3-dioxygenase-like lactoylglutathione lyase family enzyme